METRHHTFAKKRERTQACGYQNANANANEIQHANVYEQCNPQRENMHRLAHMLHARKLNKRPTNKTESKTCTAFKRYQNLKLTKYQNHFTNRQRNGHIKNRATQVYLHIPRIYVCTQLFANNREYIYTRDSQKTIQ